MSSSANVTSHSVYTSTIYTESKPLYSLPLCTCTLFPSNLFSISLLPPTAIFSIICPRRPLPTTYLCTQAPCQSSCRQSGRHGALNPRRGNNLADRCTPGCNRRREGLDPRRQHWLGSAAACRSELESNQRADTLVHTNEARCTHSCTHTDVKIDRKIIKHSLGGERRGDGGGLEKKRKRINESKHTHFTI